MENAPVTSPKVQKKKATRTGNQNMPGAAGTTKKTKKKSKSVVEDGEDTAMADAEANAAPPVANGPISLAALAAGVTTSSKFSKVA